MYIYTTDGDRIINYDNFDEIGVERCALTHGYEILVRKIGPEESVADRIGWYDEYADAMYAMSVVFDALVDGMRLCRLPEPVGEEYEDDGGVGGDTDRPGV